MWTIDYLGDEPLAVDPRDGRGAEGDNPVIGCPKQQAVGLGHVVGWL